jgi:multisubunit Na+/H+ antiporter MnhE subunit
MWMLFARARPPDVSYWTGRRWLAAIDAVAWPGFVWCALSQMPGSGGLVLASVMALLAVSATRRLFTALLANHRYHFTTWRLGRVLIWMVAVAILLRLGLPAGVSS